MKINRPYNKDICFPPSEKKKKISSIIYFLLVFAF